jgi:ribosomal protein S18 acetylase RimI-like enzyme
MIIISRAEEGDIQIITDFQLALAIETEAVYLDPETVFRGVGTVFKDATKGFYLVAKEEDRVIGALMVTFEWSDWRARTVWWIQSLYVVPEYRRQGIYKQMYSWLLDKINHDDTVGGIRLYVDRSNLNAQKVYESLGMDGNHYRFYEFMK